MHDGSAEAHGPVRYGEFGRHGGAETLENRFPFPSQHPDGRAAHAGIRQVGRAALQNGFIRRLHMGMCPDDGGNQAVQIVAGGDFFTGRFRVHVHKDNPHAFFFPEPFGFRFRDEEGVFQRRLNE